jgi:hypothetical protein
MWQAIILATLVVIPFLIPSKTLDYVIAKAKEKYKK